MESHKINRQSYYRVTCSCGKLSGARNDFALPPFCGFTPKDWEQKGHAYDEIRGAGAKALSEGTVIFSYPKYFRYENPRLTWEIEGNKIRVI